MKVISMILIASTGLLFAMGGDMQGHHEHLKAMDTDGDGQITLEEFKTGAEAHFTGMDSNDDGVLTEDDRQAFRSKMRTRHHGNIHNRVGSTIANQADADEDGTTTTEEWHNYVANLDSDEAGNLNLHQALSNRIAPGRHGNKRMGPDHHGEDHHGEGHAVHASPLDLNQDGGTTVEDMDLLFAKMDSNEDGSITTDEISRRRKGSHFRTPPAGKRHMGHSLDSLKQHFEAMDKNGDGQISLKELSEAHHN